MDLSELNALVPSANNIKNKFSETLAKSFTLIKNNNGPKIDPCGTLVTFLNLQHPKPKIKWLLLFYHK